MNEPEADVTLPPKVQSYPVQLEGPLTGAPPGILADVAKRRLCRTCRHQERSLTLPAELRMCVQPDLPVCLVTGKRKFPCIIARGHDQLCGWMGLKWEVRGS